MSMQQCMTSQPELSLQLGKAAGDRWSFFHVHFGPTTDDLMTYHYSSNSLPTQIHAIFLFCTIPLVFRISMTMSSILATLVLYWLLALLLRAQSFAISKLGDQGHLFTSVYLITAHFHSNDPHSPICFQLVTCNLAPITLWSYVLSIHNLCTVNEPLHTQFLSYN